MSPKECDCCAGIEALTPMLTANRPGLSQLSYRIGTQATFLETMKARLGSTYVERPTQSITSWTLQEKDIRSLPRFALRLRRAGDAFTVYLRGHFSEELHELLAAYDESEEATAALLPLLLEELKIILRGPSLYQQTVIAHLNLTASLHNLGRQQTLSSDDLTRLNRLLLEAAYPDLIVPILRLYPLQALTTRSVSDPAIALLDAWATVADVLTFYQERIANEGYLSTATERRSILELAHLVGYRLRPGVAASTYLAFTLEAGHEVDIPVGTRAQSLPGPGELPQPFETAEAIYARDVWNALPPRSSEAQFLSVTTTGVDLEGVQLDLRPNDPILLTSIEDGQPTSYFRQIYEVDSDPDRSRTHISLRGGLYLKDLLALMDSESLPEVSVEGDRLQFSEGTPFPEPGAEVELGDSLGLSWPGIEAEQAAGDGKVIYTLSMAIAELDADEKDFSEERLTIIGNVGQIGADYVEFTLDASSAVPLLAGMKYFWRVAATDAQSSTTGPLWTFTTEGDPPQDPGSLEIARLVQLQLPEDGSETADVTTIKLEWSVKEPEKAIGEIYYHALSIERTPLAGSGAQDEDSLKDIIYGPFEEEVEAGSYTYDVTSTQYRWLVPGYSYRWRITIADRRHVIKSEIWSFDLPADDPVGNPPPVAPVTYLYPPPESTDTSSQSVYLVWIPTDPYSRQSRVIYSLEIGTDRHDLRRIVNYASDDPRYNSGGYSYYYLGQEEWMVPQETYYWRVVVTGEQNRYFSSIWEFTTAGVSESAIPPVLPVSIALPSLLGRTNENDVRRKAAQGDILMLVENRIGSTRSDISGSETLLGRLRDQKMTALALREYIGVEVDAIAAHTTGIFTEFDDLPYPESSLDFQETIDWLGALKDELDKISDQLSLLPNTEITFGRLFRDKRINQIFVTELTAYLNEAGEFSNPLPAQTGMLGIAGLHDELTNLARMLANEEESEAARIVRAEIQIRHIMELHAIFGNLLPATTDEKIVSQLEEVLSRLQKVIQRTIVSGDAAMIESFPDLESLQIPPASQPDNALRLERGLNDVFTVDFTSRLLTTFQPELQGTFYQAWANTEITHLGELQSLHVLRVRAAPFGANLPDRQAEFNGEDPDRVTSYRTLQLKDALGSTLQKNVLPLDAEYKEIVAGGWIAIEWAEAENRETFIGRIEKVEAVSKAGYGKVSQLILTEDWLGAADEPTDDLSVLRNAIVFAQSELLPLTRTPAIREVGGAEIDLDGFYDGLNVGRWLVVSGERTDTIGTSGIIGTELVMLAGVKHVVQQAQVELGGQKQLVDFDSPHTRIMLAQGGLAYTYKRDSVKIFANVVRATHGETRLEVLGSGNGSEKNQAFTLKHKPLTYLAAPTPSGIESTLEVRVDDIAWRETDSLIFLDQTDRGYVTSTDNEDNTSVIFGDGLRGARLATGIENVRAVYRNGIGKMGNLAAERISLLATKPLGVKEVINPLPATGGADRERRDQARRNVPVAVTSLDRLVSISDYEDFSRTFAGIGKSSAVRLTDGRRQFIHLTIAGSDDIPITPQSDLYQALCQSLHRFGTLNMPVQVDIREQMLLFISAHVRLMSDFAWEYVAPQIRQALLSAFSFEMRGLGQDVLLSDLSSVVQRVPGVAYVDVDILDAIDEQTPRVELETLTSPIGTHLRLRERIVVEMARVQTHHRVVRNNETLTSIASRYDDVSEADLRQANPRMAPLSIKTPPLIIPSRIRAAQIAYLSPALPDMLILSEVTE